jgi:hypothetical protein
MDRVGFEPTTSAAGGVVDELSSSYKQKALQEELDLLKKMIAIGKE